MSAQSSCVICPSSAFCGLPSLHMSTAHTQRHTYTRMRFPQGRRYVGTAAVVTTHLYKRSQGFESSHRRECTNRASKAATEPSKGIRVHMPQTSRRGKQGSDTSGIGSTERVRPSRGRKPHTASGGTRHTHKQADSAKEQPSPKCEKTTNNQG